MAHRKRVFPLAFCMILIAAMASCAHIAGKTVARKDGPNILVASDGSICVVSKERFDKTEVGMKALCAWRGGGTQDPRPAISFPAPAHERSIPLPGNVLDIKVGEYFISAPDSVPSGLVTLRVTQTGDAAKPWPPDMAKLRADLTYHFHMVWLVRLDSARTFSDLFAAERDGLPTPWAKQLGGAGYADAPGSSNVSMVLAPGNYALVCYVGSARENRNRYHVLKGMIRPLTVTARSNTDRLPAAHLSVILRADSVLMPDTIAAGEWHILVRNERERVTDFAISKVKDGHTVDDVRAWQPRLMIEAPRHAMGGMVRIAKTTALMTTVELDPGDYLFGDKHVVVRE